MVGGGAIGKDSAGGGDGGRSGAFRLRERREALRYNGKTAGLKAGATQSRARRLAGGGPSAKDSGRV